MAKIKQALDDFKPDLRLIDERGPSVYGRGRLRQSPIERALARGLLNDYQARAAEKLYHHWWHGGMAPALRSPDLDSIRVFVRSRDYETERQQTHRKIYRIGMDAIRDEVNKAVRAGLKMPELPKASFNGNDAARVVELVAIDEVPFGGAAQRLGRSDERWAIHLTCAGLNILMKQWGIS